MKLKYFSGQTIPKESKTDRAAAISFARSGVITFNKAASQKIGLSIGDRISIAQDEDEKENWYAFIDKQHGFLLRRGYDAKKSPGCLSFNHITLVKQVLTAAGKDPNKTARFLLAGKPTEIPGDKAKTKYWGILIPA